MKRVSEYLEESKEDMIKLLKVFVQQKSVRKDNDTLYRFGKDIHKMMNIFVRESKKFNFDRYGQFNDYYSWVEIGDPELPLVGIVGHLDTVDYVEENWKYNPLGEFTLDVLYGRGVVDNKGPIVQALYLMNYIKKEKLPIRVRLIVGTDEESDFSCIKKYIENNEEMPEIGFVPDAKFPYVISEKGILNTTLSIHKDDFGVEVEDIAGGTGVNIVPDYAYVKISDEVTSQHGVASHVGNNSDGDNAIINLIEKLSIQVSKDSFVDKIYKLIRENYLALEVNNREVMIKPTYLEKIGNQINITFDTRVDVDIDVEQVKESLLRYFCLTSSSVKRTNMANGYEYDRDSKLIKLFKDAYNESIEELRPLEAKGEPLRIGGTTYAKYFPNCITFGPGFQGEHSYAHREDERLSVKSFIDGTYIYIKLVERISKEFFGKKK